MLTTSKFAKEKRNITWGLLLAIILSTMNVILIIEVDSANRSLYIREHILSNGNLYRPQESFKKQQ